MYKTVDYILQFLHCSLGDVRSLVDCSLTYQLFGLQPGSTSCLCLERVLGSLPYKLYESVNLGFEITAKVWF